LGDKAAQAGSLNAPGRLRFDFTSPAGAVPPSVLAEVDDEVNDVLLGDLDVRAEVMSMDQARSSGAIALFGEKYGDAVRVVTIGDYSKELCGGTHVGRSGELGVIKLLSEASIGSGVRRVEALVGLDAFRFLAREHVLVSQLAEQFKARPEELAERIGQTVDRLRSAERELEKLRGAQLLSSAGDLAAGAEDVHGLALVAAALPDGVSSADLRALVTEVRTRLAARPAVVALFSAADGKVAFAVATTAAGRDRGLAAGALVPAFGPAIGGRGGGKPDMAQGGGTKPAGVGEAIQALRAELARIAGGS
jgi:alanyl-tRNA synthetase